jgi:hypothetical protein
MQDSEKKVRKFSVRLTEEEYEIFNKLCHLRFDQMAPVARRLIQEWIEKNRKKMK